MARRLRNPSSMTATGAIQSRWQMNESDGVLRVVSQRGAGYTRTGIDDPEVQTFHIWNSGSLQSMGKTEITMPRQEALKSVRFDGNRAYAITFAEADPLFIIDLSDPTQPRQRGELVMPGWVFHVEPLAISDSNVTSFDLSRREWALQTADLVIATCEVRPNERDARLGTMPQAHAACGRRRRLLQPWLLLLFELRRARSERVLERHPARTRCRGLCPCLRRRAN